jgi:hypothetical protein
MRAAFGLVGLVVALAIVAVLAKKQLNSVNAIQVPQPAGTSPGAVVPPVDPNATVKEQSQQIQQQYKQAVEGALQQARPMPDDK